MSGEKHFNGLTAAEAERLAMLAEEAGEVVQAVSKILRHGYESFHPKDPATTNRELLTKEVADFNAVVEMMDVDFALIDAQEHDDAVARKLTYAHHQHNE